MTECHKCGRDKSTDTHHIVPRATGLEIDDTVPLCGDCHRYVTQRYNRMGGLTEEQHRKLFERYCGTGMTPMWDFFAAGAMLTARSFDIDDLDQFDATLEFAYEMYLSLFNESDERPIFDVWKLLDNIYEESFSVEDDILDSFLEGEMMEIRMESRMDE